MWVVGVSWTVAGVGPYWSCWCVCFLGLGVLGVRVRVGGVVVTVGSVPWLPHVEWEIA